MKYEDLSDSKKTEIINKLYCLEKKSFQQIAEIYNTYANKIRRDAKKFNIQIRDKSEAQKNALSTGTHKHPTKGKNRPEQTKRKIGEGVLSSWENMDEACLRQRKEKAKQHWDSLSEDERQNMIDSANKAVRDTSKQGSKLEKFLLSELLKAGYKPEFHKEQSILNTKLQIDIFIPSLNIAIEVDGPSHFLPVWGEDALNRNIKYDNKKTGLLLGKGCVLIRIKQTKDYSPTRGRIIWESVLKQIKQIETKFPDIDNRLITIGDC
jgi:very-short-patch-repair endonuclease